MTVRRQLRERPFKQRERVVWMLRFAQTAGNVVSAAEFRGAGLPEYQRRISELCDRGFVIVDVQEESDDGIVREGFKISIDPGYIL
jgi:hypothetical protein